MKDVVLCVMSQKGLAVIQSVVEILGSSISLVVIGQDKSVLNDFSLEISQVCEKYNLKKIFRSNFNGKFSPQAMVICAGWRWLVNHPNENLVIFHDSLLPKFRGFAPLVNMLISGETKIGVTAILGATNYDEGDIISQSSTKIDYPIKINDAIQINNENYSKLAQCIALKLVHGSKFDANPQANKQSTYSIWRDELDYFIDWSLSSFVIKRTVDALGFPYDGAKIKTKQGDLVNVHDVEIVDDINVFPRHVGKVIFLNSGMPTIICGKGMIKITNATYENQMELGDFLPLKSLRTRF